MTIRTFRNPSPALANNLEDIRRAPVFVVGAPGCGKSRNKEVLCEMLGCSIVIDDWRQGQPIVPGALHLSHCAPRSARAVTVLHYENLVYGEEFL